MKNIFFFIACFLFTILGLAQTFEADIQIRPRFEYRNGYKSLFSEGQESTSFVSQRSRINLNYSDTNLLVKISGQNIHVWGDIPLNSPAERDQFSIFEAYGQYNISSDFMIRLGRQVLSYDNQRLLGEANWGQAGQKHDAALISWKPVLNHRLDLVAAYNAEAETVVKTPYLLHTYQNMQLAWYHLDIHKVGFSFLLLNTGYEYDTELDTRETDYIQTYGAFHSFVSGGFFGNLGAYGQSGSRMGREVSAWYAGLDLNFNFSPTWAIGVGTEILSGTKMDDTSGRIKSFTPIFGTNHAYNGHMDYFYTGNHLNAVGLMDFYGIISYTSPKYEVSVKPHIFYSSAKLTDASGNEQEDYLGTEIDIFAGYKVRKDLQINFGYSQMFAGQSMEVLKGGDSNRNQNWAWVMVNFNPKVFSFTKSAAPFDDI